MLLESHLEKNASWKTKLKVLHDEDIRGLSVGEVGDSQGRKKTSWIWLSSGVAADGPDDATIRARAHECE